MHKMQLSHEVSGLTLSDVMNKLGLSKNNVSIGKIITHSGREFNILLLEYQSVKYSIPFSRGLSAVDNATIKDGEFILSCVFRAGFLTKRDDRGCFIVDLNGVPVLDKSKPYMLFGKPNSFVTIS